MAELKYDPRNYRIHTDKNKRLIKKSLEDCGTGRSILLDKNDVIIAGNGVYEQALELGLKVRIVESDGNELIAIRRTDLSTEDEKRKLLALADNHTSDTSMFDFAAVVEDFGIDELGDWELELPFDDIPTDVVFFPCICTRILSPCPISKAVTARISSAVFTASCVFASAFGGISLGTAVSIACNCSSKTGT